MKLPEMEPPGIGECRRRIASSGSPSFLPLGKNLPSLITPSVGVELVGHLARLLVDQAAVLEESLAPPKSKMVNCVLGVWPWSL